MQQFDTTPIFATTSSRRTDGTTLDQGSGATGTNRWLLGLESVGGGSAGFHALLRFPTGDTLTDETLTVMRCRLRISASDRSLLGANYKWLAWASDFGGAIGTPDYNQPYSNDFVTVAKGRIPIGTLFAVGGSISDPTVGEIPIPSRFIKKGAGLVSDFEIRPYLAPGATLAQGANITIYGCTPEVGNDRPRLVGELYTDAEIAAQNVYRFQAVGAETFFGIAQETTKGRAMKATVLLDSRSVGLEGTVQNIPSQALTKRRLRPFKMAVGRADAGGDVVFELTPEKWQLLLLGVFKYVGSIDVSADYGGGNTGSYEANFREGSVKDLKSFTAVTRRGPFYYVYPGVMVSELEITSTLDSIVVATARLVAREEWNYDSDGAGGDIVANLLNSAAAYDTLDNAPLSYVGGQVAMADPDTDLIIDEGIVQNFTIRMRNDIQEQRGHNRKRYARGHYAQGFTVEVTMSIDFENELLVRKYFGADGKDFPFAAEKKIKLQTLQFSLAGAGGDQSEFLADGTTYRQEIVITIPTAVVSTMAKPVQGEGKITLECTVMATYDTTTQTLGALGTFENGGIYAMVRNMEASAVYDPMVESYDNLITVLPKGRSV